MRRFKNIASQNLRRTLPIILVCLCVKFAGAADVQMMAPDNSTYVGLTVEAIVRISNAEDHEPPAIGPIDGLEIRREGPSVSRQISISTDRNGTRQVQTSTSVYRFLITPTRAGLFTIPPIKVIADGIATVTKASKIEVKTSETGDLLILEIDTEKKSVYVGEPLQATLRILIKCYVDEDRGLRVSEESMWSLIQNRSDWGFFTDRMQEMQKERLRPGGAIVVREGADGEEAEYYAYEIDATVYPKRAGSIEGSDVNIVAHYPQSIEESASPFGGNDSDFFRRAFGGGLFRPTMQIGKVRPIVASASFASVEVMSIPIDGRPANYLGAVGQYQIITEATPRTCTAGDPIELRIAIDGTGPMELVRAPELAKIPGLTNGFKVSDEPLAGFVNGKRKTFVTTIRPKDESVKNIPPIPYSYFDPELEEFVTVQSEPIWIYVEKAEVLSLDHLANENSLAIDPTSNLPDPDALENAEAPATDTFDVATMLRPQQRATLMDRTTLSLLILPPLLALLVNLWNWRKSFAAAVNLIVPADRQFAKRVSKATNPELIEAATLSYLTRLTGEDERLPAIGKLRSRSLSEAAIQAERLFAAVESSKGSSVACDASIAHLRTEALALVENVRRDTGAQRFSTIPADGRFAKRATRAVWFILLALSIESAATAQNVTLTASQSETLLMEARDAFHQAIASREDASAEQTEKSFLVAANKLQTVIDSGLSNGPLHYHAGKSYAAAGKRGRATAEFLRALSFEPSNHEYRIALANTSMQIPPEEIGESKWAFCKRVIREWKDNMLAFVPLSFIYAIFAVCWTAVWVLVTLKAAKRIEAFWLIASLLAILGLVSGWCYFDTVGVSTRNGVAVLISSTVKLHEGDSTSDTVTATLTDSEGLIVESLRKRGDWVQIRSGARIGWVMRSELETI